MKIEWPKRIRLVNEHGESTPFSFVCSEHRDIARYVISVPGAWYVLVQYEMSGYYVVGVIDAPRSAVDRIMKYEVIVD